MEEKIFQRHFYSKRNRVLVEMAAGDEIVLLNVNALENAVLSRINGASR